MSNLSDATRCGADKIRLPISFDASRMRAETKALALRDFIYYDVLPLRAPAHLVDPKIPSPSSVGDYADGSWTKWPRWPLWSSTR